MRVSPEVFTGPIWRSSSQAAEVVRVEPGALGGGLLEDEVHRRE
jgi:hypothetical protein